MRDRLTDESPAEVGRVSRAVGLTPGRADSASTTDEFEPVVREGTSMLRELDRGSGERRRRFHKHVDELYAILKNPSIITVQGSDAARVVVLIYQTAVLHRGDDGVAVDGAKIVEHRHPVVDQRGS